MLRTHTSKSYSKLATSSKGKTPPGSTPLPHVIVQYEKSTVALPSKNFISFLKEREIIGEIEGVKIMEYNQREGALREECYCWVSVHRDRYLFLLA